MLSLSIGDKAFLIACVYRNIFLFQFIFPRCAFIGTGEIVVVGHLSGVISEGRAQSKSQVLPVVTPRQNMHLLKYIEHILSLKLNSILTIYVGIIKIYW